MRWLLSCIICVWAFPVWGETSIFQKLATLRFTSETVQSLRDGTLDLRGLGAQENIHVQGEAYFVPGEYLDPAFLDATAYQDLVLAKKAVRAPLRLRPYPNALAGTDQTYGTFLIRVTSDQARRLALFIPRLFHPYSLWVVDAHGRRHILAHEQLSEDPAANSNHNNNTSPMPVFEVDGDFLFYGHASSPLADGKNTLNISSFFVGDAIYLTNAVQQTRFLATLISGGFLIVFIFYLFIFFFRKQDTSSLYLAFYALCSFALTLLQMLTFDITPQEMLERFTVTNMFGVCALQFFLLTKLAFLMKPRTYLGARVLLASIPLGTTIAVLTPLSSIVGLFYVLSFSSSLVLIIATLVLGFKHRLSGLRYFLVGSLLNSGFQLPIMVTSMLLMNTENGYNIVLANFFMAIALALVNAKEFAVTYRQSVEQGQRISYLNANLERMVQLKTKEIRRLLDHIPQGVLSIEENGLVASDHSAHLEVILGTDRIGLLSFKELILDHCTLDADQKDQIWQAIQATLGSDEVTFDANSDKFPGELLYQKETRPRYLKVTWNVHVQDDKVAQLLVTLLDVTAEKSLEKETEKQRHELSLIHELIHVSPAKAAQFFSSNRTLLEDSKLVALHMQDSSALSAVHQLFVNAHTVKGAARSLQFKSLARQLHEMEEYYNDILKRGEAIDRARLLRDIHESLAIFDVYRDTNRDKLNRSDKDDKVVIGRSDIERHSQRLKEFLDDPAPDVQAILHWMRDMQLTFTLLIFDNLPTRFERYREKVSKIAQETGRAEPICDFQIADVPLETDQLAALDHCMIHLLSNALDHGIEPPEERRRQGKPEAGTLRVVTEVSSSSLTIWMRDDGRGLPIHRLREKAEKQGLLAAGASPQEVAQMIFASGMSTAQQVTDISGRGVGMNAVQAFLQKARGTISIRLGEPKDAQGHAYDFAFAISFPLKQRSEAA